MTVTIPAWSLWLLPAVIGCALMQWGGEKTPSGSTMFPNIIPTAREAFGCLLVVGTVFVVLGYAIARFL